MTMLEPLDHHALLLFWVQLLVLFTAARGLGLLASRFGQPSVVGELAAGLLVGPSVFGRILPDAATWLFPGGAEASGTILAVAWVGVILLLAETGFETDFGLLARIGRSSAMVPVGSLLLPLALGIGMGFVMPDTFVEEGRVIFALFMGVCLAVSSLPVVAKILIELRLMRRNVGQLIIVAGMADDIVGWLMLSSLAGAAASGRLDVAKLVVTIGSLVIFVALAWTVGQRLTNALLRRALANRGDGGALPLTAVVFIVFGFAAVTQAIGIEAVFGAFVAGVIVSRSRYFRPEVEHTVHAVTHGIFAPIFFATAGMYVDLGELADGQVALWAVIVLAVASVGKLVGSYVGARLGPLGHREAIAVGVGLNARGALEIIIATIALSLGVFNQSTYTVIVLLAMATSMAAPPLLRWALSNIDATDEEAARLEREALLEESVLAGAEQALVPTRGGANSVLAARVLDLILRPEAHVTILNVRKPDAEPSPIAKAHISQLRDTLSDRETEYREAVSADVAEAILEEARLGPDIIALGLNEDFRGTHQLSPPLQRMIGSSSVPLLLVRRGLGATLTDRPTLDVRSILVPVNGTVIGRAAEEVGSLLAGALDAQLDLVHVVSRSDRDRTYEPAAVGQLSRAWQVADRFGQGAAPLVRVGAVAADEILNAARERDADLLVLGAQSRRGDDGHPFLGHGTEFLLEHAPQTVLVVVFPADPGRQGA